MANLTVEEIAVRARRTSTRSQLIGIVVCVMAVFLSAAITSSNRSWTDGGLQLLFIGSLGFSLFLYGRLSSAIADLSDAILRDRG
jgi:hypothetical protein